MKHAWLRAVAIIALLGSSVAAQTPTEWHDDLVDHMVGTWKMEGHVMGQAAHHEVKADWVLTHQFLRLHEKTIAMASGGERQYEAFW